MAKISKEEWENRINEAGAGRYDFVRWLVEGEFGTHKKCVVRCRFDNFEWASTSKNLVNNGNGCPQCSGQRKWTENERIEHISSIKGIEFVSWSGKYKNNKSKANVRCLIDGFEWEASVSHLVNNSRGCPKCGRERTASHKRKSNNYRVMQINMIDGIEFVSWSGKYNNSYSKANVRCKIDGFEWSVTINDIINNKTGCPKCAKTGYDPSKTGYLYALRSECGMYVKVGISNKPKIRILHLEKRTPFNFSHIEQVSGGGAKISELEKHFHSKYERAGFTGFSGATEWLVCKPELLEELRNLGDK